VKPNYQNVTVRVLREALGLVSQDAEVVLSIDEEGNAFHAMLMEVKGNSRTVLGIDPEKDVWGNPLVVLYPYGGPVELDVIGLEEEG